MLTWFYSLPRASLKARIGAALASAVFVSLVWQQWPNLDADLLVARVVAWFFLLAAVMYLPRLLVVALFGRLPKVYQYMRKSFFSKTPTQIRAEIEKDLEVRNERSIRL